MNVVEVYQIDGGQEFMVNELLLTLQGYLITWGFYITVNPFNLAILMLNILASI
jgi:hypothetical protein